MTFYHSSKGIENDVFLRVLAARLCARSKDTIQDAVEFAREALQLASAESKLTLH